MLFWLAHFLHPYLSFLRVFHYLTFRAIVAALTSLAIVGIFSPRLIARLTHLQIGQVVRDDGPQTHLKKSGTPTMGGTLIIISLILSVLLWADLTNIYIWIMLFVTLSFSAIGFVDDYRKVIRKNTKGLPPRWKFFWQSLLGGIASVALYFTASSAHATALTVPFVKDVAINLSYFYIVLSYFVIVGSSNAVNLTDGLDGLASMPTIMVGGALGVFAYLAGNAVFAHYLSITFIPGAGELVIFCAALVGAVLGFLWYNTYPAQVFMGDVGSIGLGAALGALAIIVHQEIIFFIMSGVFVAETLSVIIQVSYFKMTRKRVFRMAPLHHHFELKGWPEPKVIVRFWIITFVLVLIGLASLKLR